MFKCFTNVIILQINVLSVQIRFRFSQSIIKLELHLIIERVYAE